MDINEMKKVKDELINIINIAFDEAMSKLAQYEQGNVIEINEYEQNYSLIDTKEFKGKKIIAVKIDGKRSVVPTWKKAVELILKEVIKDNGKEKKMRDLCDKLLGRTRKRLSSSSDDMRSPIKLAENLYIETHYDTEALMKFLLQILNEISYDYSKIRIIIKN